MRLRKGLSIRRAIFVFFTAFVTGAAAQNIDVNFQSNESEYIFGEPICETIVAGDINGDCRVDFKDLAIMALHWTEDNRP